MFKALIKSVVFFFLVIINMTLILWCINQLDIGSSSFKNSLLKDVQAEVKTTTPSSVQRITAITQRPIYRHSTHTAHNTTHQEKPRHTLVLQFKSEYIRLEKTEQDKLEEMLQSLNIKPFHSVKVFSSAADSEQNGWLPKLAILRIQSIARLIYPYTQNVKMYYHSSSIDGDQVVVNFFEPPLPEKS
jgi:hypothetical protein